MRPIDDPILRGNLALALLGVLADAKTLDRDKQPATPREPPKPLARQAAGRNEPCPCGSGKKYKRCCRKG